MAPRLMLNMHCEKKVSSAASTASRCCLPGEAHVKWS